MDIVLSAKPPCRGAIPEADGVWLVPDTSRIKITAEVTVCSGLAARDAVPERRDLPREHPLYGRRALRVVPAGSPDLVVEDDGTITPWVPTPEKPEPIDIGGGEVIR